MVALEDLNIKKDVTVLGIVSLRTYRKAVQTCDISRSCRGIKVQRRQKYMPYFAKIYMKNYVFNITIGRNKQIK